MWERALSATDARGGAEALLERLLAEYGACAHDVREGILQEVAALLHACASCPDVRVFLDDVSHASLIREPHPQLAGFHDLHVVYQEQDLQNVLMLLATHFVSNFRDEPGYYSLPGDGPLHFVDSEAGPTNRKLLDYVSQLQPRPRICQYIRPEGDAQAPKWYREDDIMPKRRLEYIEWWEFKERWKDVEEQLT